MADRGGYESMGVPTGNVEQTKTTVSLKPGLLFFHLQGKDKTGNWGPILHFPLVASDEAVTRASTPNL